MLERIDEARVSGRRAGRWFGVVAVAAVIGIGAAGCTADTAALVKKAEGDEAIEIGPMRDIDPASIEGIAHGTASVEGGGEVTDMQPEVLPETEMPADGLQAQKYEDFGLATAVHMFIANAATESVTKLGSTISKVHSGCGSYDADEDRKLRNLPAVIEAIDAGRMGESCMQSDGDAFVQATYTIDNSPYLFWTYAKTPRVGNNEVKCTILNAKDWKEVKTSPYSCTYEWLQDDGHGLNPMPKIKLWKKPDITVTDPVQVQQILSNNCKSVDSPNCKFTAKVQRFETLPKKQWILYGNAQGNCIDDSHAELKVGDEQEVSWKKMIGVTATGEMHIGPVKAGLEATYEYAWAEKQTFKEEHSMTIPKGKIAGFYIAAGVLHVEGDFMVRANNATYLLPNTVFNLPLTEDYHDGDTVIQKGPILPVAWNCPASGDLGAEQAPAFGIPDGAEIVDPAKID